MAPKRQYKWLRMRFHLVFLRVGQINGLLKNLQQHKMDLMKAQPALRISIFSFCISLSWRQLVNSQFWNKSEHNRFSFVWWCAAFDINWRLNVCVCLRACVSVNSSPSDTQTHMQTFRQPARESVPLIWNALAFVHNTVIRRLSCYHIGSYE